MVLYFLRHGLAGQHGDPQYPDDSLRPLTSQGRKKMQYAVLGMKNLSLTFDVILSSPYLRARQTAEIVAQAYKINEKNIHITKNLLPPRSIEKLLGEVHTRFPKSKNILFVGHEPHLSEMISAALKCNKPLLIDFKKGGLCSLTVKQSNAVLNWLLSSKQLGMMAKEKQ